MTTNFPEKGDDKKISLRNSNFPQFDYKFAKAMKDNTPKIWRAGGNIRGNEAYEFWTKARNGQETEGVTKWIKEREAWASRHFRDGKQFKDDPTLQPNMSNVAGVVAQIKWGVIGTLGEQRMKDVILELTKKQEGKKNIDIKQVSASVKKALEKKITKKTKVLLIPNLIGNIPDWKKISALAKKYNLIVIEDSADTLGAKIDKFPTGKYSDISITSFYGSHIISCAGNGGMFLTNNREYYNKAKVLRSWGRMSTLMKDSENINKRLNIKLKGFDYDRKFVFSESGYNFEPSEIGASFGLEQIKKLKKFIVIRNQNFSMLLNFFNKQDMYFITPKIDKNVSSNFLAYPIILKENKLFNRKKLQIYLEKNKIQTRPIFSGNILRHPAFTSLINKRNKLNSFKNSDYIMKNGLLIGCHQGLLDKDIKRIQSLITKLIKDS